MIKKTLIVLSLLLLLLSFSKTVSSVSPPTVYILNSNQSIEKLFLSENSFKKHFSGKVKSFDLKELIRKREDITKLIRPAKQDLIYCIGSSAFSFALKTYQKKRLIFSSVINWRRFDISELTYGISNEAPLETQLTLFKHMLPSIKKIGIVYSPKYNQGWFDEAQREANAFSLKLVGIPYKDSKPIDEAFAELLPLVDAVWLIPDPVIITRSSFFKIVKRSEEMKKPLLTYSNAFVENGAVLAVSVEEMTVGRQTAVLIEQLIKKATIKERIQKPAGSNISLNLKKVKEFKLMINANALGDVNRIIE